MIPQDPKTEFFSTRRFAILSALLLAAMYYRVLFIGESFYYRDFGVLAIPTASYHKVSILAGEIPFWNPFSNCGAPFLAQWGTMVLYPLSLIYVLLPMPWSLNLFCIVHLWLGSMGMFLLARRWCGQSWPAAIAGVAFTFNGITQAALAWPNYIAALSLFPWVVLTVERAWNPKDAAATFSNKSPSSLSAVFTASLFSAAQLLAGVPELCVFTWILVTALWLLRLSERPSVRGMVPRHFAVIAATSGFIAIQLLPFYELLQNSQRAAGFAAEKWSLSSWGWFNLVLPRFRTFVTPEGTAFQYGQEFLTSTYLGIPLLALAAAAFLARVSRVWLLVFASAFSLVLALGSSGFLYPILTKLFPPLSIARYPVKFLFILTFTIPLLAAIGAQTLSQLDSVRRKKFLIISGVVSAALFAALIAWNQAAPLQYDRLVEFRNNSFIRAAFTIATLVVIYFALTPSPRQSGILLGLLLLLVSDSRTHLRKLNPTIDSVAFKGEFWTQGHKLPKPTVGNGRIFITPDAEAKLLHSSISNPDQDLTGKRLAEWSHLNLLDRVPKVNGSSTLQVREQARVQTSLYSGTNQNMEAWLDFLNVTFQSASNSPVQWAIRTNPAPFVTAGQKPTFGDQDILTLPIDFSSQVVIHTTVPSSNSVSAAQASLSNIAVHANKVRFDAVNNSTSPAIAVIAQSWFPSWRYRVIQANTAGPGFDTSVLRANLAFQGLLLPPGKSSLLLYYDDHSFKMGAAISAATLLLFTLAWVREKKNALSHH